MTANELQIGDWVSYVGKDFNDFADKISGIIDGCVTLDKEMIHRSIDKIHPIPLTQEILEKNGFSHIMYSDAYYSITIGDTYVELRKYENMAVWFNWEENNDGVYADYILPMPEFVHELQHALRLCNIEKEIVL